MVDGLISDLCWQIEQARELASQRVHQLSASVLDNFSYALAAYTDECLILSLQERLPSGFHGAVEKMLFGTSNSGEQLFSKIKNLLGKRVDREIALAAVYLMLLVLGFRGKYLLEDSGEELSNFYRDLSVFSLAPINSSNSLPTKALPNISPPALSSRLRSKHIFAVWIGTAFIVCAAVLYSELVWLDTTSALRRVLSGVSKQATAPKLYNNESSQTISEGTFTSDGQSTLRANPVKTDQRSDSLGLRSAARSPLPSTGSLSSFSSKPPHPWVDVFLSKWADSWSSQDVESYLSYYSPEFIPEDGLSRVTWEIERRRKLKKNYQFSVLVRVISLESRENKINIIFEQTYKSSRLNTISNKEITLIGTEDKWLISRERVISETAFNPKSNSIRSVAGEGAWE